MFERWQGGVMAGGMNRRPPVGRWPPVPTPTRAAADAVRPAPAAALTALPAAAASPGATSGPVGRHCWVLDPPGAPGRWPGLLTEWRRDRRGWSGFVMYVVELQGRPVVVQEWIGAEHLRHGVVR
jgi:hypothetical protein